MNIYKSYDIGSLLRKNEYPGRGIIVGKSRNGKYAVTAYFIMGRSENSRNRVFNDFGDEVMIHPFDASKVEDPSLIIYSPVKKAGKRLIVTNGDQTETIYQGLLAGKSFEDALMTRKFEPDAPNFTPRISGICYYDTEAKDFTYRLSILKSANGRPEICNRYFYRYGAEAGIGHFIHTYKCDGNPIPSFYGEPEEVTLPNTAEELAELVWTNLNEDNKVSLFVRCVPLCGGEPTEIIINKNK